MRSKCLFSSPHILISGVVLTFFLVGNLVALNHASGQTTNPLVEKDGQLSLIDTAKKQGANCIPALTKLSNLALGNAQYSALTLVHKGNPTQHIFTALNFLNYPTMPTASYGMSILLTAPSRGNDCDSENVNIRPTSKNCEEVAADLAREDYVVEQSSELFTVYPLNSGGQKTILMRNGTSTGCIVVSTGSYFYSN